MKVEFFYNASNILAMKKDIKNRRKKIQPSIDEMYKKPNIKDFIKKERREKELHKLHEVRNQANLWRMTVFVCGIFNLILVLLAISGIK